MGSPSFHPHEPVAAGLARIVGELVDGAVERIEHPVANPGEDIHEIRTSIKRLRALLLLIRPVVSETSYERENARLRNAARSLGSSRDAAVARETLITLAKSATGRRERERFAKVLDGCRAAVEPPSAVDRKAALREVAAALRQSREKIPRLRLSLKEWQAIGPGLEAVYHAGRRRMKRAFATDDDVAFHRWRIRAKNLFYQLQTLTPIWPARLCKFVGCLKRLQGKIGDDHDLALVKSVLQAAPDIFGGACAVQCVLTCAERRSRKLRKAGRKIGEAIYDESPKRLIKKLETHWREWRQPTGSNAPRAKPAVPLIRPGTVARRRRRVLTVS